MEFGGVFMNKFLNRAIAGTTKLTTDVFQIATGILFQNPVQMFALTPNNLTDAPATLINFMKEIPTTWNETLYIDGYPGKYSVIARRHGSSGTLPGECLGGTAGTGTEPAHGCREKVSIYSDNSNREAVVNSSKSIITAR